MIASWHKARDGRGLNEETRKKHNIAMLEFIVEDKIPWYKENRDYSTLDPNTLVSLLLFLEIIRIYTILIWQ